MHTKNTDSDFYFIHVNLGRKSIFCGFRLFLLRSAIIILMKYDIRTCCTYSLPLDAWPPQIDRQISMNQFRNWIFFLLCFFPKSISIYCIYQRVVTNDGQIVTDWRRLYEIFFFFCSLLLFISSRINTLNGC